MRRLIAAVAGLILLATPVLAGPLPALTSPPTGLICSFATIATSNDAVYCSWDPLLGATKYSVDAIVNYDLGSGLGSQSGEFDFGTPLTEVTIPLSAFPGDIDADGVTDTIASLVLRVKGLVPPGKTLNNQNNAFSVTVTCTLSGGSCS